MWLWVFFGHCSLYSVFGRLREISLFSIWKGKQMGDFIAVNSCLMGRSRADRARVFLEMQRGKAETQQTINPRIFQLDTRIFLPCEWSDPGTRCHRGYGISVPGDTEDSAAHPALLTLLCCMAELQELQRSLPT